MVEERGLAHVGDIGHDSIIQVYEASEDGSSSSILSFIANPITSQKIIIKDPDGIVKFNDDSTFVSDGSDGKIHAILGDIFDAPGPWTKQARLTFDNNGGTFHTEEILFEIIGPRV